MEVVWIASGGYAMNIQSKCIMNLLTVLLGLFVLFNVLYFIQTVDVLFSVMRNYTYFRIYSTAITIIISGFGVNFGILLLNKVANQKFVFISFIYTCIFFVLQVITTIIPNAFACKCTTLSEVILNIQDWTRVELALGLLVLNAIVWILFRKFKVIEATPPMV